MEKGDGGLLPMVQEKGLTDAIHTDAVHTDAVHTDAVCTEVLYRRCRGVL